MHDLDKSTRAVCKMLGMYQIDLRSGGDVGFVRNIKRRFKVDTYSSTAALLPFRYAEIVRYCSMERVPKL